MRLSDQKMDVVRSRMSHVPGSLGGASADPMNHDIATNRSD